MPATLHVLVGPMAALLLSALPGGSGAGQGASAAIVLGSQDDGRVVVLQHGQQVEVRLPAHSASGYRCWLRGAAAAVLDLEQEPARVAGAHSWRFRAITIGTGDLLFECGQELASSDRHAYVFHVRVR